MNLRNLILLAVGAAAFLWLRQVRQAVLLPPGAGDGSVFNPWPPMSPQTPAPELPLPVNAPRGIRNHNPGNIRRGSSAWQGMAPQQTDAEFVTFSAPVWGLRAAAKLLLNYQGNYGLMSLRQVLSRWAPPSENNTAAYVAAVASALNVAPDDGLDLRARPAQLEQLLRAIVTHENGRVWADYYAPELYRQAVQLAL